MEESDQPQPQLLSVCMEGEQEMVIQVENARSLQGTTLVPVQVIPDVSAIPRNGGIEWNSRESKVLLENYVRYVPQVGPDKKFRSKKDMFKRIAEHIFEETGKRRTGEQCENRYKTIMRRKRRNGEGSTTGITRARILLHKAAVGEDREEEEEHIIEEEEPEIEDEEGQSKKEELQPEMQQEEPEDDEPELLAELAAMGDDEQRMIRRSSRRRKNTATIDQQLLLDRLHELHEQRERRRDERERRRDLRHAEQMSLLRRILSVLERQPLTNSPTASRLRVAATHR